MKRILFAIISLAVLATAALAQSGYGGDGKTSGDSSVASYIRLYETAPSAATTALAGAGAGNVDNGAHLVKVTCYTSGGQTTGSAASNSTTVADKTTNGKIAISSIPTCSNVATGRKVYMTTAGGSTYYLLSNGTIANNTATTLTANDADATLTASTVLPTTNTALDTRFTVGQSTLTSILPLSISTSLSGTVLSATGTEPYLHIIGTGGGAPRDWAIVSGGNVTFGSGRLIFRNYTNSTTALEFSNASRSSFNGAAYTGQVNILPDATSTVGLTVQMNSSQTGDGLQFINSGSAVLSGFSSTGMPYIGSGTPASIIGTTASHGQNITYLIGEESLTIAAAATTDTTMQIPANAVVLSVNVRVTTVIPTAATFTVTGASSATVFNTAAVNVAANTTDAGTKSCPYYNATAQSIRITPNIQPAAATGVVRVTVVYYVVTPPTS